jgi:hypothetical protein
MAQGRFNAEFYFCEICKEPFEYFNGQVACDGIICDACLTDMFEKLSKDPRLIEENGCKWSPKTKKPA